MEKVMDYYGIDEGIFSCTRRNVCDSECLDDSYTMCQRNPSKCKKMKKTMTCIPGSEPDYMGRPVCVCDPAQGYMPPLEGNHKFKGCEGISQPIGGKREEEGGPSASEENWSGPADAAGTTVDPLVVKLADGKAWVI